MINSDFMRPYVFDLISGQRGRFIMQKKGDMPATVDIQIYPAGFVGMFKKVWIKNILENGGMTKAIVPNDTSLIGCESEYRFIIAKKDENAMRTAILKELKIIGEETIQTLTKQLEVEQMSKSHFEEIARAQTEGSTAELKQLKQSHELLSSSKGAKDDNMNRRRRMFASDENTE